MNSELDQLIPIGKVVTDARQFLAECEWHLEFEQGTVRIPDSCQIEVQSRAYVAANAPDIFLGDHLEAVVMLGCEKTPQNWMPRYGYLKMYYDLRGRFVSEDRFSNMPNKSLQLTGCAGS